MANNGLCSLIEAGKLPYAIAMYYQDRLIQQRPKIQNEDNRVWV